MSASLTTTPTTVTQNSTISTTTSSRSAPIQLSKELLKQARDRLLEFQNEKMEASEDAEPIIIAQNVSLEAYIKYIKTERKLPIRIRLVNGKIIAHEIPLSSHGAVANRISFLILAWNNQLRGTNEEDLIVGSNYYTADLTIRPLGLSRPPVGWGSNSEGRPYPTLVVEVGNSESIPSLHDLSTGYFSPQTTIQIYIAIKIFPTRHDGTRAMLALRYLRTNQNNTVPDIIISFGTGHLHHNTIAFLTNRAGVRLANITGVGFSAIACNAPRIPNYQLHIFAIELFNGAFGGIPAGAVNGFFLDLWELQDIVLNDF
ncbi:hypothetical protein Glove_457g83 [Diversispora epigaea]|uniref:Restriction endonuclease domain-containing protein n=1 Tax=Diversispora epigaea TaxID=1348612 RepID=A0A397GXH7_9GLOM|nr:hypothetical protein Glove_457g83 [Diversispora epigaea]